MSHGGALRDVKKDGGSRTHACVGVMWSPAGACDPRAIGAKYADAGALGRVKPRRHYPMAARAGDRVCSLLARSTP
jgi:hypothetical protein